MQTKRRKICVSNVEISNLKEMAVGSCKTRRKSSIWQKFKCRFRGFSRGQTKATFSPSASEFIFFSPGTRILHCCGLFLKCSKRFLVRPREKREIVSLPFYLSIFFFRIVSNTILWTIYAIARKDRERRKRLNLNKKKS